MLGRCLFGVSFIPLPACHSDITPLQSKTDSSSHFQTNVFVPYPSVQATRHASVEANDVITTITTLFDMHTTLLFGFNRACLWKRRYSFGGVEQEEENLVHMPWL